MVIKARIVSIQAYNPCIEKRRCWPSADMICGRPLSYARAAVTFVISIESPLLHCSAWCQWASRAKRSLNIQARRAYVIFQKFLT